MRRFGSFAAWILVTVLATGMTWQIVSAAQDQVSDSPLTPIVVSSTSVPTSDDDASTSIATVPSLATTPSSTDESTPSTTTIPDSSTTSSVSSSSTTSAASVGSTTTSTTGGSTWSVQAITTPGGTVVVSYRPGEVIYDSATPAPGFSVEVERAGPPEVRVVFESEGDDVEVRAKWANGELDIEISEED